MASPTSGAVRQLLVWRLRDIPRRGRLRHRLTLCREEFCGLPPVSGRACSRSRVFAEAGKRGRGRPRRTKPESHQAAAPLRNESMAFSSLS